MANYPLANEVAKGYIVRAVYYYGISVIVQNFNFKIRIMDLSPEITLSGFVPTFFSSSWLCKCFVKIALDFPV